MQLCIGGYLGTFKSRPEATLGKRRKDGIHTTLEYRIGEVVGEVCNKVHVRCESRWVEPVLLVL